MQSTNINEKIVAFKREVFTLISTGQKCKQSTMDIDQGVKIMFNNRNLENEINKFGLITVGGTIKNPTIFCFGTRNLVLKYNIL